MDLNGDDCDYTFVVRAFTLAEQTSLYNTSVRRGSDYDIVLYAVNDPVDIDGGNGFDTVVAVGTEASNLL